MIHNEISLNVISPNELTHNKISPNELSHNKILHEKFNSPGND